MRRSRRRQKVERKRDVAKHRQTLSFHAAVRKTLHKLFTLFIVTENTIKIFPPLLKWKIPGRPKEINQLPNILKLTKST